MRCSTNTRIDVRGIDYMREIPNAMLPVAMPGIELKACRRVIVK
jgi:hypothetical protein